DRRLDRRDEWHPLARAQRRPRVAGRDARHRGRRDPRLPAVNNARQRKSKNRTKSSRRDAETREEAGRFDVARIKYLVVPAEAGIQAKIGAPCAHRPIGVGEQYRCSPPSEPYGRFSRIRLSGQWLSTSRLALKSVSCR